VTAQKAAKKRVERASHKALETALADERLAVAALTKVMLQECPDPMRFLARLEAMVHAAEQSPRTPVATRRQLIAAATFVRTAIERETGKPQSLFEPNVGHVSGAKVDALVDGTDGPSQLGLLGQESVLGDASAAHDDRVTTIKAVHDAIIILLRERGPLTDRELHGHYLRWRAASDWPPQSYATLSERRKELTTAGRVVSSGRRLGSTTTTWDVVERDLIEGATA
jgi:hypothetical protein